MLKTDRFRAASAPCLALLPWTGGQTGAGRPPTARAIFVPLLLGAALAVLPLRAQADSGMRASIAAEGASLSLLLPGDASALSRRAFADPAVTRRLLDGALEVLGCQDDTVQTLGYYSYSLDLWLLFWIDRDGGLQAFRLSGGLSATARDPGADPWERFLALQGALSDLFASRVAAELSSFAGLFPPKDCKLRPGSLATEDGPAARTLADFAARLTAADPDLLAALAAETELRRGAAGGRLDLVDLRADVLGYSLITVHHRRDRPDDVIIQAWTIDGKRAQLVDTDLRRIFP